MLLGDLDGDGLPDAVTGWGSIVAWQNPGDPFDSTWLSRTIASADNAMPKAIVDMTGDGYADVIAVRRMPNYNIALVANDGTPFDGTSWTFRTISDMPGHVTSVAVADINHDGRLEIIAGVDASGTANAIYALYCDSDDPLTGTWSRETLAEVTYTVNVLKVGDIDGDGWIDIVFGQPHAPAVGTMENPVDPRNGPTSTNCAPCRTAAQVAPGRSMIWAATRPTSHWRSLALTTASGAPPSTTWLSQT